MTPKKKAPQKKLNPSEDLRLDKMNLDLELEKQASLYFQYSEEYAKEKGLVDQARLQLDLQRAEVGLGARENPKDYGFKLTADAIVDLVANDSEVKNLNEIYISHRERFVMLERLLSAFEMKAKALDKLTQLYLSGYFQQNTKKPVRKRA